MKTSTTPYLSHFAASAHAHASVTHILLCLFSLFIALPLAAETRGEAFYIYRHNGTCNIFLRAKVDSITFSTTPAPNSESEDLTEQVIWTGDSTYRIPLTEIDSVSLIQPASDAVDMGLSVKWATHNVGAAYPEDYGEWFGWGDPTGLKTSNNKDDYPNATPPLRIGGTDYDAAHVRWGGKWRMPTYEEARDLIRSCTYTWTTVNGVDGGLFTSKTTGNSVFFPAAGTRYETDLNYQGSAGYYWTDTHDVQHSSGAHAYALYVISAETNRGHYSRVYGLTIRPVTK
jgi:hypothetical protein